MEQTITNQSGAMTIRDFARTDSLIRTKMQEYLPHTLVINSSALLFSFVDTVVVGRLIGGAALAAVSLANPIFFIIRMLISVFATGISTNISVYSGENNQEGLRSCFRVNRLVMVYGFILITLVQIPVAAVIIASYHLESAEAGLVWAYMISSMVGMPFYLLADISKRTLQVYGKMKNVAKLTVAEQLINLLGDITLIRWFHLGIYGAGFATSMAVIFKGVVMITALSRQTDVLKAPPAPWKKELWNVIKTGFPAGQSLGLNAMQTWVMALIVVQSLSIDGIAAKAVCSACYNLMSIGMYTVTDAMRPIAGMMYGAGDRKGCRMILRNSCILATINGAAFTVVFELFPQTIFHIYGIPSPTPEQLAIFRIFCTFFVLNGFIKPVCTYFTCTKQVRAAARITSLNGSPVFIPTLLFLNFTLGGVFVWWAYTINALVAAVGGAVLLAKSFKSDSQGADPDTGEALLYLSLQPKDGVTVSEQIERFVKNITDAPRLALHTGILVEELTMYIWEHSPNAHIDILMNRRGNIMTLSMFDDGAHMDYTVNIRKGEVPDRLQMARLMTEQFSYQYILNLNYICAEFSLV